MADNNDEDFRVSTRLEKHLNDASENLRALSKCKLHNFGRINGFKRKLRCKNCGGVMDTSKAVAYAKGYKAAGKDINDIIQGL